MLANLNKINKLVFDKGINNIANNAAMIPID